MARLPDGEALVGPSPVEVPAGTFFRFEVLVGCEAWGSLPGLATGPRVGATVGVRIGDAGAVVSEGVPPSGGADPGFGETGAGAP